MVGAAIMSNSMGRPLTPCAGCNARHMSTDICCANCWELVPIPLRHQWVAAKIGQPYGESHTVPAEAEILEEILVWLRGL